MASLLASSLVGVCGALCTEPPAYLLELSFHAASGPWTAGDKGGQWPSMVLTALGGPVGWGRRPSAVLLALLMLALEPVEE